MTNVMNYISTIAVPAVIGVIIVYGLIDKKNVFDIFVEGASEGMPIVIKIFPTLLGIFLAIGALKSSGILEAITKNISFITNLVGLSSEVIPLALLRPISGSGSLAVATEIMKTYGVDSRIGLIASTIMGSTETTFYTIAIYTSAVGIKKTRGILVAALAADVAGMLASTIICRILS